MIYFKTFSFFFLATQLFEAERYHTNRARQITNVKQKKTTMKTNLFTIGKATAAIALMTIVSCQRNQELDAEIVEDEVFSQRTTEESAMEELYTSTDCNYEWTEIVGPCATVTASSTDFPKTIVIDFGEGCVGPYGKTKKGKINIEVSDDIRNNGATRVITFDNFFIEEVQVEGTRTATNIGASSSGYPLISIVGDLSATKGGDTWTRTFERQREWIAGSETCERSDDEFLITGEGSTVGKKGYVIDHTIITPLHIAPAQCNYIQSGSLEVTYEGKYKTRGGTIDWGAGDCDNMATLTTFKGDVYDINLDTKKIIK